MTAMDTRRVVLVRVRAEVGDGINYWTAQVAVAAPAGSRSLAPIYAAAVAWMREQHPEAVSVKASGRSAVPLLTVDGTL